MARQTDKSKLERVTRPVVAQPSPPAQGPIAVSTYRAPLANQLQTTTDDLSQLYSNSLPVVRHAPLAPAANPSANASINSSAQVIAENVVATDVSIGLIAPEEITVRGSRAGAEGTFQLSWTPEVFNQFFAAPSGTAGFIDHSSSAGGDSSQVSISIAPNGSEAEVGIYFATTAFLSQSVPLVPDGTGWTPIDALIAGDAISARPFVGQPFTATSTINTAPWAAVFTLFGTNGQKFSVVQNAPIVSGATTAPSTWTAALPNPVTKGTTILIYMRSQDVLTPATISATDSLGNEYRFAGGAFQAGSGNPNFSTQIIVLAAAVTTSGTCAITVSFNSGFVAAMTVNAYEVTGLGEVRGIPAFRYIVGQPIATTGDLPLPTLTTVGAVAANTAVAHEWLVSINADGSISLAQPAFTDISGIAAPAQLPPATGTTQGAIVLAGDLGGTSSSPQVVSTHLVSPLPVIQGGTGTTSPSLVAGTAIGITGTWPNQTVSFIAPASTLPTAMEVNGAGVSTDKLVFINGVQDGSLLWQIKINGTLDGG